MKIYAIGDVHGCREELDKMLTTIYLDNGNDNATIVFLGDYVDRGPDSKGVLDIIMNLKNTDRLKYVFLMGNHEDMMLHNHNGFMYNGGYQTLTSFGVTVPYEIPNRYFDFVKSLKPYHQEGRFVFVHAGLDPFKKVSDHDLDEMIWTRDWNHYDKDYEDGVFVVHGHTPVREIDVKSNQINIDTGCVFGNKLSAILIENDEIVKSFEIERIKE